MHGPLNEAKLLIDTGRYKVLSLDIFDTTVWRCFSTPTDLFFALGRLLLDAGRLYSSASPASFAAERTNAEQIARDRRKEDSEVTLGEIYQCFPQGYLQRGGPEDLQRMELELERNATRPDAEVVALIDHAVGKGLQVAFVSDTYFEEQHLRNILPRPSRFVINSCRYRRPKAKGSHAELIRQSGVRATQILHIGDNLEADFHAPARLGIKTLWRSRFPKEVANAIEMELPAVRSERATYFSGCAGDGGLNALRAQVAGAGDNWNDPFRSWGALILGPLVAGFGRWVIERCVQEQLDSTACLMREGRILKRVLDSFESPVRNVEFYASRYALMKISIFQGHAAELRRYLSRPRPTSAHELLTPIGLSAADLGLRSDMLVTANSVSDVSGKIAADAKLRGRVLKTSAEGRRRFLTYLKQTFPEIPTRIAVVDLGYSGTIQRCLQAIFDHESIRCKTHGLYFVTGSGIRETQRAGAAAEGFLAENGQPLAIAHTFMRSPEVVEQCLMCDLGTTRDYDEAGEPVLGERHLSQRQLAEIERVQQGLMTFVARFVACPQMKALDLKTLRPFLEAIIVRAMTSPAPIELASFGSWVHDENFGSTRTHSLIASDLDENYLDYASAHQLASLKSANAYWIFGLAHRTSPVLGEAVRSIFLRKVNPNAFRCPEDERTIYFFWNDGQAHRASQDYTLSSRRKAWVRFSLEFSGADLFEIGFSTGRPGDVIKIGGIILRLQRPGVPVQVIRKSAQELETFGMERLSGSESAFLITDTAGFAAPVEQVRNFSGLVEVDLLFGHFETGDDRQSQFTFAELTAEAGGKVA